MQYQRLGEREAWLYENQDDPEFDELHERTNSTARKFNRMQNELIQWAGADVDEWFDLIGEVLNRQGRAAA